MKIMFECHATAFYRGGDDRPLDAAQLRAAGLDGLEETRGVEIAPYLDDPLIADEGLVDAGVRYWVDRRGDLNATLSFRCVTKLSSKQLNAMSSDLQAQLMDGWGSGRIVEGITPDIWIDWFERRGKRVPRFNVQQTDDGEPVPDLRTPPSVKAAEKGDVKALQAALDAGADINAKGKWGMTALMLAARDGHEVCVDLLLQRSANANLLSETSTALGLASMSGYSSIVRRLLAAGANPSLGDKPALHWAANREHEEVARILLEAGADKSALDDQGETALFMTRSPSMVRLLLEAGLDINFRTASGQTALDKAIEQAEFDERIDWAEGAREWRAAAAELQRWRDKA
jgi:hypothetical protein